MSRVAKRPVALPKGVTHAVDGSTVTVKGAKGALKLPLRPGLSLVQEGNDIRIEIAARNKEPLMPAGSLRSHLANVVQGVSQGYEKKLELVGVGYRAAAQGKKLNLTLGFSHPVEYDVPEGITIDTPTQTEIVVKGADKQQVGQVAAEIRSYRPPEPYKGKGVRYSGERIELKETKKK
ncbi:MAG: 50S ribosomal protein L6 [Proteobacteria bacterium]|nr:50S ribosomal protein L6 [Pseudomonadota bacterium]